MLRPVLTIGFIFVSVLSAVAAPAPEREADAIFPEGCFPGDRRAPDLYEVELEVFGGANPIFGPETVRAIYPAACDAGNWNKVQVRRTSTLNLHGDVETGLCHTYDEWTEFNPFQERRFTLSLNAFRPIRDLNAVIRQTAPQGEEPLNWRIDAPGDTGYGALRLTRNGRPLEDIHQRWAATDEDGRPTAFLICRKKGTLYNAACEHHAIYDRARMIMTFGRWHLPRVMEIEAIGRRMLQCALRQPLPKPRSDG